ncbi:MAG: RodZ domain-containing protein [Acidimicrobiales bacterium]
MTALVLVGLALVIAAAVAWSRVALYRSERRSMKSHEHALHVLGDVARRSDAAVRIKLVSPDQGLRGHVRTEPPGGEPTQSGAPALTRGARAPGPTPRELPVSSGASSQIGRPRIDEVAVPVRFEDDSDAFDRLKDEAEQQSVTADAAMTGITGPVPALGQSRVEHSPATGGPTRAGRGSRPVLHKASAGPGWGRMASLAAGVVVVAVLVLVGLRLSAGGSTPHAVASGARHHHSRVAARRHKTKTPTSTTPSALVPVSTSSTDVAFVAPKGTYTVVMVDSGGTCWVGIQQTSGGPYVWQETLYSGQQATYKASGPLVVRIGAPRFLGVKVNGIPARLPGFVQPYDLTFNPATPPSSA